MNLIPRLVFAICLFHWAVAEDDMLTIFDFTSFGDVSDWVEQSDPVRFVGMSKATMTMQKTLVFHRAVFFALLNPQPNGAGFAGMRKKNVALDLLEYDGIAIKCRGQGQYKGFKVVLRHKGLNDEPNPTYEQMFTGPDDVEVVKLPFEKFKPYYRGQEIHGEKLDITYITGFGFQFYGGVYLPVKQKGPATLEVDWVKAYKNNNDVIVDHVVTNLKKTGI